MQPEILKHPFRVNDQILADSMCVFQHSGYVNEGGGNHSGFDGNPSMIPFVEPCRVQDGRNVTPDDFGQTAQYVASIGVPFMRRRRARSLRLSEGFLEFSDFGALSVENFKGDAVDGIGDKR